MKPVHEQVISPRGASLRVCRVSGKQFGAPYHVHPEIEITWIVAGSGRFAVGDHLGRFTPGDVHVHGAGLPHSYHGKSGQPRSALFVQFREDALGRDFWNLPECLPIRRVLDRARRGLRLSRRAAKEAARLLGEMESAGDALRLARLIELCHRVANDRSAVPLASRGYAPPRQASGTERVGKILRAVEHGWKESLSLKDVARLVGLHPQSLSRFCRRHFKKGFSGIVIERRLAEASRKLFESDETIARIAFDCGFNNLSNFNALFRKAYGCSPRKFRGAGV